MNENKTRTYRLRMVIALAILAVVAVGYFAAGGIGNICGIGFESLTLLCPLGALMALLAEKTAIPVAVISVVAVLAICIVLGKVFCSWVCPVHFFAGPKRRRELAACEGSGCASLRQVPCGQVWRREKSTAAHGILAAAFGSTLVFGFPVFCLVCPVGLTFATVLLVMRLFAFGETTWTIIVLIALIAAEVILLPRWCAKFCPLGALLSLMSGLNRTFRPHLNAEKCLAESRGASCDLCVRVCPEGINLHDIAGRRDDAGRLQQVPRLRRGMPRARHHLPAAGPQAGPAIAPALLCPTPWATSTKTCLRRRP